MGQSSFEDYQVGDHAIVTAHPGVPRGVFSAMVTRAPADPRGSAMSYFAHVNQDCALRSGDKLVARPARDLPVDAALTCLSCADDVAEVVGDFAIASRHAIGAILITRTALTRALDADETGAPPRQAGDPDDVRGKLVQAWHLAVAAAYLSEVGQGLPYWCGSLSQDLAKMDGGIGSVPVQLRIAAGELDMWADEQLVALTGEFERQRAELFANSAREPGASRLVRLVEPRALIDITTSGTVLDVIAHVWDFIGLALPALGSRRHLSVVAVPDWAAGLPARDRTVAVPESFDAAAAKVAVGLVEQLGMEFDEAVAAATAATTS